MNVFNNNTNKNNAFLQVIPDNDSIESEKGEQDEFDSNNESSDDGSVNNNSGEGGTYLVPDTVPTIASTGSNRDAERNTIYKGIPQCFPPYTSVIKDVMRTVFGINEPKEWQLRLVQALVFSTKQSLRFACIR